MPPLPLGTRASAAPQSPLGAVSLDALEPLRYASPLVVHDATEENASFPLCSAFVGPAMEGCVHPKAVLLDSRVYQSLLEVVLSLFNYFLHHRGLRCKYIGRGTIPS